MANYINLLKCAALVVMVLTIIALVVMLRDVRAERDRFSANQSTLLDELDCYLVRDSLNAASIGRLQLTRDELQDKCTSLTQTVRDLHIKLRRVESITSVGTETTVELNAPLRDTIVVRDTVHLVAQGFEWRDAWCRVRGVVADGRVSCLVESRDTLVQVVHRVPHKWWFFRWGTKAIRQEIISKNPHTRITYAEYIELK